MKRTARRAYKQINNDLYNKEGESWWQPGSPFHLLQSSFNPARVGFIKKVLLTNLNINAHGKFVLEVGCGGGLLCEEISGMGFDVTGIDPSESSLQTAAKHAKENGLSINYLKGEGEALPFQEHHFDVVLCCDVLEHVKDVPKVISEISRVLKPGGCFCFDTINRTFRSKLVAIYIAQEWKRWAFAPHNLHVWEMFIKPDELNTLFAKNNLNLKEQKGMAPNVSYLKMLSYLRKRAQGALNYKDLGEILFMKESENTKIMYMGYAVKNK